MFEAFKAIDSSVDIEYHKSLLLCSSPTEKCRLLECDECPSLDPLIKVISDFFNQNIIETISYRSWVQTDRPDMVTAEESSACFSEKYAESLNLLIRHDYVTKSQLSYIDNKKRYLNLDEVVVEMDFSENFSHFSQNEIQAAHFYKVQTSVHPVVITFNLNGEIQKKYCFYFVGC